MSDCQTCDGTGWYRPQFSASAVVNCADCNDRWLVGTVDCPECGGINDDCERCDGWGCVVDPALLAALRETEAADARAV